MWCMRDSCRLLLQNRKSTKITMDLIKLEQTRATVSESIFVRLMCQVEIIVKLQLMRFSCM